MALMRGNAPLGERPAGVFNATLPAGPLLYLEPTPRWVRAVVGGATVVDSRRVQLLHETGQFPCYYFSRDEVRMDLLEISDFADSTVHKGRAVYWSVRVGAVVREDAAWSYPDPVAGAKPLAGLFAFSWTAMDHWYEESEEVFGYHPRDPYHRIDTLATARELIVSLDGHQLASTKRAIAVYETGHPSRSYIPREDVVSGVLVPDDLTSTCAYKGRAEYFSVRVGERLENALVWSYPEPRAEAAALAGMICFFDERVDVSMDGVHQERGVTPWSTHARTRRVAPPV